MTGFRGPQIINRLLALRNFVGFQIHTFCGASFGSAPFDKLRMNGPAKVGRMGFFLDTTPDCLYITGTHSPGRPTSPGLGGLRWAGLVPSLSTLVPERAGGFRLPGVWPGGGETIGQNKDPGSETGG